MKKGDIVCITDGSYAMCSDNGERPVPISGTVLIAEGKWGVLETGSYLQHTENSTSEMLKIKKQVNNLKVRSIRNPNRIVWTQMRFCYTAEK